MSSLLLAAAQRVTFSLSALCGVAKPRLGIVLSGNMDLIETTICFGPLHFDPK